MSEEKSKLAKKKFAKRLAFSFHEQFAQNQNHHQRMFVQILAVLITVLAGFGYAYSNLQNGPSDSDKMHPDLLYPSFLLSMVLFSFAIAWIASMAYGFRRDQATASRIRIIAGAMGKEGDSADFYFPLAYNPFRKSGNPRLFWIPNWMSNWMPEYHKIFYFALIVVKIILVLIVINQAFFGINPQDKNSFLFCVSFIVFVGSICVDCYVLIHYRKKWEEYLEENRKILKIE